MGELMRPLKISILGMLLLAVPIFADPLTPALPAPSNETAVDLKVQLAAWEKAMARVENCRFDFELTRTEATFGTKSELTGSVLIMKPGRVRLRLDSKSDRHSWESFIISPCVTFHY